VIDLGNVCPCCGGKVFADVVAAEEIVPYQLPEPVTIKVCVRDIWCEVCGDWSSCGTDAA